MHREALGEPEKNIAGYEQRMEYVRDKLSGYPVYRLLVRIRFGRKNLLCHMLEGRGYSSLRKRATGMFNCSRYLATVRLAML